MTSQPTHRRGSRGGALRWSVAIGALALVAAACGSSSKSSSAPTTAKGTGTTGAATTAASTGTTAASTGTTAPSTGTTAATKGHPNAAGYDWSDVDLSKVSVNVGQILPLTGGAASYADLFRNGSNLAAEQIKAAGGPTLTFDQVDNASGTPETAITAARKLVSDGVPIAQTSFPEASIAIVPVIDSAKLLTFNPAGATPEQLGAGQYLWMAGPDGQAPLKHMADYEQQTNPNAKKAAVIAWNTATGINSGKDIAAQWKSLGGDVTTTELVDIGAADVGPQVARVLSGNPDAVFLVLFGPDNANVIKALRDRGFKGDIVGSEYDPQFKSITGNADEGYSAITYALDPTLNQPFNRLFVDGFKQKYGHDPESFSSMFYENTWLIADLIARAVRAGDDPTKAASLYKAFLANPSTPSSIIGVPYTWDTKTHGYQRPFVVSKVTNGQPKPVGLINNDKLQLGKTLADLQSGS
jgi:branched-chain amino acid transport system substrate-binding protein